MPNTPAAVPDTLAAVPNTPTTVLNTSWSVGPPVLLWLFWGWLFGVGWLISRSIAGWSIGQSIGVLVALQ